MPVCFHHDPLPHPVISTQANTALTAPNQRPTRPSLPDPAHVGRRGRGGGSSGVAPRKSGWTVPAWRRWLRPQRRPGPGTEGAIPVRGGNYVVQHMLRPRCPWPGRTTRLPIGSAKGSRLHVSGISLTQVGRRVKRPGYGAELEPFAVDMDSRATQDADLQVPSRRAPDLCTSPAAKLPYIRVPLEGLSCSTPSHIVERDDGKTGSRRALRARADRCRGRHGRPVLQASLVGTANSKRRNCAGVRGLLLEVPEASMSAAAAMQLTRLHGEPRSTLAGQRTPQSEFEKLIGIGPAGMVRLGGPRKRYQPVPGAGAGQGGAADAPVTALGAGARPARARPRRAVVRPPGRAMFDCGAARSGGRGRGQHRRPGWPAWVGRCSRRPGVLRVARRWAGSRAAA